MALPCCHSTAHSCGLLENSFRPEDVLVGDYVHAAWAPELIARTTATADGLRVFAHDEPCDAAQAGVGAGGLLSHLQPHNCTIALLSKTFSTQLHASAAEWLEERWFGVRYQQEPLRAELLNEWKYDTRAAYDAICAEAELHLPPRNTFIATDFAIAPILGDADTCERPSLIAARDTMRVWWKRDVVFGKPLVYFYAHFFLPLVADGPHSRILSTLYVRLVEDALTEVAYMADQAGLNYRLSLPDGHRGLTLRVNGYNQKLGEFAAAVIGVLHGLDVKADRFGVIKEELLREYKNELMKVDKHGRHLRLRAICEDYDDLDVLIAECEAATVQMVADHRRAIFDAGCIECFVHGNATADEALRYGFRKTSNANAKPRDMP